METNQDVESGVQMIGFKQIRLRILGGGLTREGMTGIEPA